MATAKTAWWDASMACLNFLANRLRFTKGGAAFLGDINSLPDDRFDLFVFLISGSGALTQDQNFQSATPAGAWSAEAILTAQFLDMDKAFQFEGQLRNNMPANTLPNGKRGILPNVCVFESLGHPEMPSRIIGTEKNRKQVWMVQQDFRVIYNNNQT